MPGSIASCSGLSNEFLDTRRHTRSVERANHNATFPLPPFGKGGSGGISETVVNPPKSPFTKGGLQGVNSEGQVMIAASPEVTRRGIVLSAAHVFPSFDDHHKTAPSTLFLPTENPEGPLAKGEDEGVCI